MICNNIRAKYGLCLCVGVLFALAAQFAIGFAGGDRQRPNGQTSRQEQLRQEAQNSAAVISSTLTQILQSVNQNRRPDQDLIDQAASTLLENRRFASIYDDAQKARYMLLQSWSYYYQDNLSGAMNWALRSCKTDQTSQDAWISQALFCQLNGKRPLEPRIRRSDSRENTDDRRPGGRANQPTNTGGYASESEPYGHKGTLSFDLSALRSDLLREHFNRLDLKMSNGANLTYILGENILCMLVWQVEPSAADAGDASDGREINRQLNNDRMRNDNREYSNNSQSPDIKSQGQYFSNLYEIVKNHPQITCFSLNTNGLEDAKKVATDTDDDFAREIMDKPIVFAEEPESGAAAFVGVNAKAPFMLIADKEGVIRYAGPAANFMPAFVLTRLTDVEIPVNTSGQIDVQTNNAPTTVNAPARIRENVRERPNQQREVMTREMLQQRMNRNAPARTRPAVDPNRPAVDPNAVSSTPSIQQTKPDAPVEMTLEDQVKADKLLALAQMEIETTRKLPAKSPEKGIEACKEILEKYPGTEYAEKARAQLRRVPQQYWEKYEIADILGY